MIFSILEKLSHLHGRVEYSSNIFHDMKFEMAF